MAAKKAVEPPRLLMQGVVLLAIAISVGAFHSILRDAAWWFVVVGVVAIVSITIGIMRRVSASRLWPSVAGLASGLIALTAFFAPASALLFLIPTFGTVDEFGVLVAAGMDSIATQGTPARATAGIVFLLAAGFAVVTVLLDVLVFTIRRPALVGLPLLALIAVPSLIDTTVSEPIFFVLLAAAYLVLILASVDRVQSGSAVRVGAAAIVGALVLAIALPAVSTENSPASQLRGYSTGVNPFIKLGEDLRRPDPVTALTYTTTSELDQYFTIAVLEDFSSGEWEPTIDRRGENDLESIGPVPGRDAGATVTESETRIEVGNISGDVLPIPYAPTSVEGLDGSWTWDPDTLTLRARGDSMRGQSYTVTTEVATPSAQELNAAGTIVDSDAPAIDLSIPSDLPPIVAATARTVVAEAGASSNFEKAMALQQYFRGGTFSYSEEAPVDDGYDGSSADVIGRFLEAKAGYCVHFSSAMASMARTLGIPARIGVGFTTGSSETQDGDQVFTISTDDLHAWPELFFDQIGWVRFEPTAGRGTLPNFGSVVADDPNTPEDESTTTPSPTASASAPASAAPSATPSPTASGAAVDTAVVRTITTTLVWIGILVVLALLLLLPAIVRSARRSRRRARVRQGGSAIDAWSEIRDTATDLGLRSSEADTPRSFAAELSTLMTPAGSAPLSRLLTSVERQAYAKDESPDSRAGDAAAADTRAVIAALRGHAETGARLRARFVPASILSRFRRPTAEVTGPDEG